jgi:hypothetical protein
VIEHADCTVALTSEYLSVSPLLLGEGPGVRVVAGLSGSDRALSSNLTGLATTLTPALSQEEREAEGNPLDEPSGQSLTDVRLGLT